MSNSQRKFIEIMSSIPTWNEAGCDRFKISHRSDGRLQLSWKYQKKRPDAPYTITDHSGFM